ncbi:MAG: hypothetical protein C4321_01190 [Chloroflexota bacterium]
MAGCASKNAEIRRLLAELDRASRGEADHARRVAVYAVATADRMGVPEDELVLVRDVALLHDIGKVALDLDTLRKLGSLSDDELAEMRRHAMTAVAVLGEIPGLAAAIPGIRAHHERWNGTGYPDGLRREAIPFPAQVVGLAESFDVMAFGAAWMPCLGANLARDFIQSGAGKEWDPEAVRAFLAIEPLIQPIGMRA